MAFNVTNEKCIYKRVITYNNKEYQIDLIFNSYKHFKYDKIQHIFLYECTRYMYLTNRKYIFPSECRSIKISVYESLENAVYLL